MVLLKNNVARKKKELPLLEKVTITDVAAEGKALAKVNDLVVFVPYVVPGDVVDLQVKRKKNHYAEAVAVKFHEKSPMRTEPFCQHYGVCGGCKWQCLSYEDQIKYKQKQVFDNLTRIGKVELPEFRPILGSEKTKFYRNKLEFTFSNKRWLTEEEVKQDVKYDQMNAVGFHIPGAFDKVLAIEKCWLQDDISNRIRNAIRDYAYEHNFSFFDLRSQEGLLRNMMVRTSSTGELMVLLQCKVVTDDDRAKMMEILQFVADSFPEITSLMYVINNKCNDTIGDLDVEVFKSSFYFAYNSMRSLSNSFVKRLPKDLSRSTKLKMKNDYCFGFIYGCVDALKENEASKALMIVTPQSVVRHLQTMHLRRSVSPQRSSAGSRSSMDAGFRDGKATMGRGNGIFLTE